MSSGVAETRSNWLLLLKPNKSKDGNAASSCSVHAPSKQRRLVLIFSMSPQIRADAARISPFPQTLVAQQDHSSASTADNNDRTRPSQTKAKKARNRPRQERNLRSDEDIRFNVGPLRKMIAGNGRRPPFRMGRQDRLYHDGINDGTSAH